MFDVIHKYRRRSIALIGVSVHGIGEHRIEYPAGLSAIDHLEIELIVHTLGSAGALNRRVGIDGADIVIVVAAGL